MNLGALDRQRHVSGRQIAAQERAGLAALESSGCIWSALESFHRDMATVCRPHLAQWVEVTEELHMIPIGTVDEKRVRLGRAGPKFIVRTLSDGVMLLRPETRVVWL